MIHKMFIRNHKKKKLKQPFIPFFAQYSKLDFKHYISISLHIPFNLCFLQVLLNNFSICDMFKSAHFRENRNVMILQCYGSIFVSVDSKHCKKAMYFT